MSWSSSERDVPFLCWFAPSKPSRHNHNAVLLAYGREAVTDAAKPAIEGHAVTFPEDVERPLVSVSLVSA